MDERARAYWQLIVSSQPGLTSADALRLLRRQSIWPSAARWLLDNKPTNAILQQIVQTAPKSEAMLRQEVGLKLLEQDPRADELMTLILYIEPLQDRALTLYLAKSPPMKMLIRLCQSLPFGALWRKTWRALLQRRPSKKVLRGLATYVNKYESKQPKRNVIGRRILQQAPSADDLDWIVSEIYMLRNRAARRLLKMRRVKVEMLSRMLRLVDSAAIKLAAGTRLLQGKTTEYDLSEVAQHVPSLRRQAWNKIAKGTPTGATLRALSTIPELHDEVEAAVKARGWPIREAVAILGQFETPSVREAVTRSCEESTSDLVARALEALDESGG